MKEVTYKFFCDGSKSIIADLRIVININIKAVKKDPNN